MGKSARELWASVKRDLEQIEKRKEKAKVQAAKELVKGVYSVLKQEAECQEKLSKIEQLLRQYEEILKG